MCFRWCLMAFEVFFFFFLFKWDLDVFYRLFMAFWVFHMAISGGKVLDPWRFLLSGRTREARKAP